MSGARLRRWGAVLAAAVGLPFVLRAFVADVYPVVSGSMRPTLEVGEWVLVRYGRPELERGDLVVIRLASDGPPLVKRVAGLPNETVRVLDGDVVVDGRKLEPDLERLVPIYDSARHALPRYFRFDATPDGPWSETADGWRVDAAGVARGRDAGLAFFHKDLRDGWIDEGGERAPGLAQVGDGRIAVEARVDEARGGRLRLRLVEEGDTFELAIDLSGGVARLTRTPGAEGGVDVLAEGPVPLAPGAWHRLALSNVDDHLAAEVDGERVLAATYDANRPYPGLLSPGTKSLGPRVAFGAEGATVTFRAIAIERDRHWPDAAAGDEPRHAVEAPLALGPDELFVLGDHGARSRDSRAFGPVPTSAVIGVPVAVVWPPGRARGLGR